MMPNNHEFVGSSRFWCLLHEVGGGFRQFIEDTPAAGHTLRAVRPVTTPNR